MPPPLTHRHLTLRRLLTLLTRRRPPPPNLLHVRRKDAPLPQSNPNLNTTLRPSPASSRGRRGWGVDGRQASTWCTSNFSPAVCAYEARLVPVPRCYLLVTIMFLGLTRGTAGSVDFEPNNGPTKYLLRLFFFTSPRDGTHVLHLSARQIWSARKSVKKKKE